MLRWLVQSPSGVRPLGNSSFSRGSSDGPSQTADDPNRFGQLWLACRRYLSGYPADLAVAPGVVSGAEEAMSPAADPTFVLVLAQGRTGSTLILRLLNATPGVRMCGENEKAFDHLKAFADCFQLAANHQSSEFFKHAWLLPCDRATLMRKIRSFVLDLYNPNRKFRAVGFKEIRYARFDTGRGIEEDLAFLRELFPTLRVIFSVRRTDDCVKSSWWAKDPQASAATLERMREAFDDYYQRNRDHCYWMPYEELKEGSAVLQGMFDFLGVPWTDEAQAQLGIRLRE